VINETSFFNFMTVAGMNARATARCNGLAAKGLVAGADIAAQSLDALQKLRDFGWTPEADQLHNSMYGLGNNPILAAMYPTSYGRFSVTDNVCNTSFAQVNATGDVVALTPAVKAQSFALANGTANGTPASVVYNDSVGGAKAWQFAVSRSTGVADFGLDNALCQRALVTGTDPVTGAALTADSFPTKSQSDAVRAGINELLLSGNMRGKPAIIVAGRSDGLVPSNDNGRAYAAFNHAKDGSNETRYIEVTNAQHFDTFIPLLSGYDTRFVPLHVYFNRSMDAMYAKLKTNAALPPSQVVRTTPRGGTPGAAPAITAANVPAISASPAAADAITFSGTTLAVPN
jgi:hydroxybutyrate-dimer hydrolase